MEFLDLQMYLIILGLAIGALYGVFRAKKKE